MIQEVTKFKTTDGREHNTREAAEQAQAILDRKNLEKTVGEFLLDGWTRWDPGNSIEKPPKDVFMVQRLIDNFPDVARMIPRGNLEFFDLPNRGYETYERQDILRICEMAFVPQDAWSDRDSAAAQQQLGECYAYLKAGCDFELRLKQTGTDDDISDDRTIRLTVWVKGFNFRENYDVGDDDNPRDYMDEHSFYLPSPTRIVALGANKDWY